MSSHRDEKTEELVENSAPEISSVPWTEHQPKVPTWNPLGIGMKKEARPSEPLLHRISNRDIVLVLLVLVVAAFLLI